ncbi:MAG: glycosyltransferase family 4 protein [Vicingaceae bacterium]|nr:glycosyltransferase family 4 protein [Flavobacteriales bacterium]WKZ74306.1 MAG: glycosyltransferase family 4 protein [Vicingaceae bacterium]
MLITSAYPRYKGEERDMFIYRLAEEVANEFEVIVLAPRDKNTLKREVYGNVKVIRHSQFPFNWLTIAYGSGIVPNLKKNIFLWWAVPFYFLFQIAAINRVAKRNKVYCIHAHWLIPNAFSAALYKKGFNKNVKLLVTAHGSDVTSFNHFIGRKIKKFILKNTNTLTVVGENLKKILAKENMWKKDILVYPMGTDTSLFKPDESTRNMERINLLFVGRIIREKGIYHLIEALPEIKSQFPNVLLHIIGEGNERQEVQESIIKMNLSEHVRFYGHVPHSELPRYYSMTDIFILPSFSEGFGLVLTEAMACGCISLCSNIEPLNNIVENKQNGFLLDRISAQSIAKLVISILNLPIANLQKIKIQARKRITENLDLKTVASNYKKIYYHLLNE